MDYQDRMGGDHAAGQHLDHGDSYSRAEMARWHLDRNIPLILIFLILVQTAGAFWWASSVSTSQSTLKDEFADLKGLPAQVAVLNAQVSQLRLDFNRVLASNGTPIK